MFPGLNQKQHGATVHLLEWLWWKTNQNFWLYQVTGENMATGTGTLSLCWWECKMGWPLRKHFVLWSCISSLKHKLRKPGLQCSRPRVFQIFLFLFLDFGIFAYMHNEISWDGSNHKTHSFHTSSCT
jgi:hypothetical protein